jgi:hypothetical protein
MWIATCSLHLVGTQVAKRRKQLIKQCHTELSRERSEYGGTTRLGVLKFADNTKELLALTPADFELLINLRKLQRWISDKERLFQTD